MLVKLSPGYQGSISPMFYEQLLWVQIPKAQKLCQVISLFVLLGSAHVKATSKMLMKLTPSESVLLGPIVNPS
jgi:hypothetical protein